MSKDDEKEIHAGHRKRLLELSMNAGFENITPVQAVEMLLTYIFPRGDVNPLAHRLLQNYDTFTEIVDADWKELMKINGINERSAQRLTLFKDMFFRYAAERMGTKCKISNIKDLIDIVEDNLRFRTTEHMLLLAISGSGIVTRKKKISINETAEVSIPVLELTNFLSYAKPVSFAIAHCHPFGNTTPSKADEEAFKIVEQLCNTCGINFVDSYILGENGVYSQRNDAMMRRYLDVEQLQATLQDVINGH